MSRAMGFERYQVPQKSMFLYRCSFVLSFVRILRYGNKVREVGACIACELVIDLLMLLL